MTSHDYDRAVLLATSQKLAAVNEEVAYRDATLTAERAAKEAAEREVERYKTALLEYETRTQWVQQTVRPSELGMHRADILRSRIEAIAAALERAPQIDFPEGGRSLRISARAIWKMGLLGKTACIVRADELRSLLGGGEGGGNGN